MQKSFAGNELASREASLLPDPAMISGWEFLLMLNNQIYADLYNIN